MQADTDELSSEAGPLPISLITFWQEVGGIDFVGRHPGWPDGLDPLVVDPPEGALSFLFDEEDDNEGKFAGLAPDDLHKDNTSGGRSEERRVGKECRSRGSPYHEKKKERKTGYGSMLN